MQVDKSGALPMSLTGGPWLEKVKITRQVRRIFCYPSAASIGVTGSISSQKKLPQKYTAAET